MKEFIINEKQIEALLTYLVEKPFKEVVNGINMLQNLKEKDNKNASKEEKK